MNRKHPAGTTGLDRANASNRALKESGGSRVSLRLSPTATRALNRAMRKPGAPITKNELIQDLIIKAGERRTKPR